MLDVVHVASVPLESPDRIAIQVVDLMTKPMFASPLVPMKMVGDVAVASGLLAAVGVDGHAFGILVDHGVVVVDVAELGVRADLASAQAPCPQRRLVVHCPDGLVQAVDVLLGVEDRRRAR